MGTLFQNANVFDGHSEALLENYDVLVEDGRIVEMSDKRIKAGQSETVACNGRTLMPGLIDAHVHVYGAGLDIERYAKVPLSYSAHYAAKFLRSALDRGFTTVRDVGGADYGLAGALRDGLLVGPRLYYGGPMISQTGGHGDFRSPHTVDFGSGCGCGGYADSVALIADGADAVRAAVREQFRRGAHHVKIMAAGGVASPTDPLSSSQYSDNEILAAVDEAERFEKYVAAHCHSAKGVRRAAALGVRTIEHATLIDEPTASYVASTQAFVVPTIVIIHALHTDGKRLEFPAASMEKLKTVYDASLASLELMQAQGVRMGLGTDLIGPFHTMQNQEFAIRARIQKPLEILRSACSVNAEILNEKATLGCVKVGAHADLLLLSGNPLSDVTLLARPEETLDAIMIRGEFHRRRR